MSEQQNKRPEKENEDKYTVREGGIEFKGNAKIISSPFAAHDLTITQQQGISIDEFNQLFVPLEEAVHQAPPDKKEEAEQKTEALKAELAKGDQAADSRVAKLLDGIVELVPGTISAVATMFASPILQELVGPVTQATISKIIGG